MATLHRYELNLREEKRDAVIRVAKVRRHIIGNITFIGELFLVDMVRPTPSASTLLYLGVALVSSACTTRVHGQIV